MTSEVSQPNRLWGWIKTGLIYLVVLTVGGAAANVWMTRDQYTGPVPVIKTVDVSGQTHSIGPDSSSNPQIIYFFAEWCPICKGQNGAMSSIAEDYRVLGVAMQSGNDQQVRDYLKQQAIDFPVINDESGALTRAFGVHGVPATFIVDQQGQVRYSTRGLSPQPGLRLRLWISSL
jgi:peroxiredoxin